MNRISDKLANVLGSVGIAALAIAILLVPYSDLNAAASSGSCYCCNSCGSAVLTDKSWVCKIGTELGSCSPGQPGAACYSCQVEVIGSHKALCYCEAKPIK